VVSGLILNGAPILMLSQNNSRAAARYFGSEDCVTERLRLCIIGGPDVDKRIPLLQRLDDDFEVSAIGSEESIAERFEQSGYKFESYSLSRRFDLGSDFQAVFSLRSRIRRLRPHIVHCFDTKPSVVGRIAARLEGVPVVLATLPGLGGLFTYHSFQVRWRRWVYLHLHRLACRLSDRTVFQNTDDRDRFCRLDVVSHARSHLIRGSGVCASRFNGDEVSPAKRIEKRRLSRREVRRLRQRVIWLGERAEIPDLLACSDVLVFPSFYREGIPRVLVEAALLGVPIACADNVGSCEVVEHQRTGLCFPAQRPRMLANAVLRLLDDLPLRSRLAAAARRHALRYFELSVIADQHQELYRDLWESHSRPPSQSAICAGA
jgi:glycosyltransferase involved in cell wall biosynthesis